MCSFWRIEESDVAREERKIMIEVLKATLIVNVPSTEELVELVELVETEVTVTTDERLEK